MATIRPNAEPAATATAVGDVFLIDGPTGVRALAASAVAPTNSPAFINAPTAPTASVGTNTTQIATTAFVLANISLRSLYNALDFGVTGNGSTNDAAAINTFLTTVSTAGGMAFFPGGKTYDCGGSSITVPDGLTVMCGRTATFRRSATIASPSPLLNIGNYNRWFGGIVTSNSVPATSATSQTISSASLVFTTQASVPSLFVGQFVRLQSRANKANHMEGTVTAYSGTSLTVNIGFTAGSGTLTDWDIYVVSSSAVSLSSTTESTVESVRVTGNWYVGMIMQAFNSGAGITPVSFCTFRNCFIEGVQNRAIYLYGTCSDNLVDGCFIDGLSATTDYGVNLNPGNPSGSANLQTRNKIIGTDVNSTGFQGFEIGDQCFWNVIDSCTANSVSTSTGVGFLIQLANGLQPQYNRITSSVANNCTIGFEALGVLYGGIEGSLAVSCGKGYIIGPSGGTQSNSFSINNSEALGSTTIGFQVQGNSTHSCLFNIKAVSNGTNGVQIDAGAVTTRVSGMSFANTSAQLVDNGTTSSTTNLGTT